MANKAALAAKNQMKTIPKYEYPDHVLTAAMLQKYAKHGVDYSVRWCECETVSALDEQKKFGKKIFGSGLLLSDQASAKKATAEKATAEKVTIWNLSAREREIVRRLSLGSDPGTHSGIDPQENEIDSDYLLQEERFAEYTAQQNLLHMMEDGK